MKLAAIQMVSGADVDDNLRSARALLEAAAQQGAELAALPENFCFMGHRDADKLAVGEPFGDGPVQRFLSATARELGLWLVGGTLPIAGADAGHVRAACLVHAPDGACVARYDKIHLFRFDNGSERYDEARHIEAGSAPCVFELPSRDGHRWRVGLSVCYDIRFPELYRPLGADLLLVPSAFTWPTGQAHWELLLRARAVENLTFVAGPAQGGRHQNGRRTWGQTLIADPWGVIAAQRTEEGPGVVVAELDAARLAQVRSQLPALAHRVLA